MQTIDVRVQVCLVSSFVCAFLPSTFQHFFIFVSPRVHFPAENGATDEERDAENSFAPIYTYARLYHYL